MSFYVPSVDNLVPWLDDVVCSDVVRLGDSSDSDLHASNPQDSSVLSGSSVLPRI